MDWDIIDFSVVTDFIVAHRAWAIPLTFLVSFAESFMVISLLVPGFAVLAACGALVPSGTLTLAPLMIGAIPGAVLGDAVSYWLGRRFGPAILQSRLLRRYPDGVAAAQAFLRRHGVWGVAIGRFFGPLRAAVPLAAGIAEMDRRWFWIANVLSAIVWAPAVILSGALLGWVGEAIGWWTLGGIAVAVAVVAGLLAWRRRALS